MSPYDIAAIERRARELRAEEIRRLNGLFAERLCVLGRLLAATGFSAVIALAEAIRPLFSWNPQAGAAPAAKPRATLAVRANRIARRLFAWNPEVHHHV
ncbi:RSP_7527 family protein [Azospira restricta]|uniref:Uncharacterized protein n=1 Tax=Azospira restricta TaxID=404405 RepID=A0A974SP98_9RHOO|nr:hypothetical protein [Azospira restricta]QRJ63968.1 hypothetical protein IWH25_00990 [Azospira restricta]